MAVRHVPTARLRAPAALAAAALLAAVVLAGCTAPGPAPSPSAEPSASASPIVTPAPSATSADGFDYGLHPLDDPNSLWVIVNKTFPLDPEDHVPGDLATMPSIPRGSGQSMRAEAAAALESMYADAKPAGAGFSVSTAYRSYDHQAALYYPRARDRGVEAADRTTARPGYSEHQSGLAVDIFDTEDCRLEQCFGSTVAGKWVAEHAWEYGFVMRYPEGKEDITGYIWEPWHLRYVGPELAAEMHQTGITTLEEFFGLPAAPEYAESP